ncbi:unnamed protein product [Paramecium pentaurelia]|uniref:Uncharacterized protein n=1 Tax=Paramecium pentaurelia TaxID=43138 RepID=A0A8S1T4Q6_9CILI|nr:unnamed protein product [Paramecium pentaurelia]
MLNGQFNITKCTFFIRFYNLYIILELIKLFQEFTYQQFYSQVNKYDQISTNQEYAFNNNKTLFYIQFGESINFSNIYIDNLLYESFLYLSSSRRVNVKDLKVINSKLSNFLIHIESNQFQSCQINFDNILIKNISVGQNIFSTFKFTKLYNSKSSKDLCWRNLNTNLTDMSESGLIYYSLHSMMIQQKQKICLLLKLIVHFVKEDYYHLSIKQQIKYKNSPLFRIYLLQTHNVDIKDVLTYLRINRVEYYFSLMKNKNFFQDLKVQLQTIFAQIIHAKRVHAQIHNISQYTYRIVISYLTMLLQEEELFIQTKRFYYIIVRFKIMKQILEEEFFNRKLYSIQFFIIILITIKHKLTEKILYPFLKNQLYNQMKRKCFQHFD